MTQIYKKGIFSWFGFVMPLPERVKLIKKSGFDSTSLWWEDELGSPQIKKEEMPQIVREAGLYLENIHVPFNNCNELWSESTQVRNESVKQHMNWLEDCAKYDIPIMVMHITDEVGTFKANKYGIKSLSKLTKEAEEIKVKIAIENTNPTEAVSFVLSEIPSEYLGFCFDSSHAQLCGGGQTLVNNFGERLLATHISDNDGRKDRHWLPGNGLINWKALTENFPQNYKGYLTLEVCPTEEERTMGPKEFLQKGFEKIAWVSELLSEESLKHHD